MPPLEQELPTLPENLSSPLIFSVVRVARLLVFSVVFCRLLFVLFLLTIVLSVLRFTDSDYSFGIFKVFFFLGQVSNPIYFQSVLFKRKLKHNIKQPCLFSFILWCFIYHFTGKKFWMFSKRISWTWWEKRTKY